MKKKKEDELEEKCHCHEGKECTCGDNCTCGDDCTCGDNCECCGDECTCEDFLPPLEEKLVLIGKKDDQKTKEAIKKLDKKEMNYSFIDLDNEKDERFLKLQKDIEIPSLLLVQTLVVGGALGLEEIDELLEGE